jgi:hypothetical protein
MQFPPRHQFHHNTHHTPFTFSQPLCPIHPNLCLSLSPKAEEEEEEAVEEAEEEEEAEAEAEAEEEEEEAEEEEAEEAVKSQRSAGHRKRSETEMSR